MNKSIDWVIYVRKSSESDERQIQSLRDQLDYLNRLAEKEGLNVIETISDEKSAKAPDVRIGFNKLIGLIEKGKVQGILCWKLDRLSRNPIDSGRIQWYLQNGKIKCISTSDRTHLPDDNVLLFAVEQGAANQFILDLKKNVKRGLYSKAEKGWYPSIPPIGYLNTNWGKKGMEEITIDPKRFEIVRRIWDLMLSGTHSPMKIHRIATNEWKLDTPKRKRTGEKPIAVGYIYKMLTNIFYTGNFSYGGKLYKGNHKPMITFDEFERVQALLLRKNHPRPVYKSFAYTGIMKCANCGAFITASRKTKLIISTKEYKDYTYYHCTRRVGIDDCHEPPITVGNLETQVITILQEYSIDSKFYEIAISVLNSGNEQSLRSQEIINSKRIAYIGSIQKKLERLFTFLLNGTITEEQYTKEKGELEKELLIETEKLNDIEATERKYKRHIKDALSFCKNVEHLFRTGNEEVKRNILTYIGWNQRLYQKKLCIDLYSWLSVIKSGKERLSQENQRLELEKANNDKVLISNDNFFLPMCAQGEHTGTDLSTYGVVSEVIQELAQEFANAPNTYIPDLLALAKSEKSMPLKAKSEDLEKPP